MAVFRGSGSWIPEVAGWTLLTRYIREYFKITTFSRLSGIIKKSEKAKKARNSAQYRITAEKMVSITRWKVEDDELAALFYI